MEIPNNLILDIYDSAQHCPVSDFNDYVLNIFNKAVQFDSAMIVDLAVTPNKEFLVQSLHLHGTPVDRFQDRHSVLGSENFDQNGSISTRDLALKSAYAQRGKSVVTDIEKTFFDADILKYCKKYETAHSLAFISGQASAGTISAISFARASEKNAFQKNHNNTADLLLPHILQARKINRSLTANIFAEPYDSSTVLANFNGCLHFLEDKAIKLFQLEWKQWTPPLLPASLIASLRESEEKIFIGASIYVKASVQGNIVCLVVAAKNNQEMALSNAEYRTAKLAAEGLQYKEIARKLGVSPATVRNQLHSAYKKLGVSNKAALSSALPS